MLVPRRVLSSLCGALFDGWFMPYSCTAGASHLCAAPSLCWMGNHMEGGKNYIFLPVFGHILIFKNIKYLKNEKMEFGRKKLGTLTDE